MIAKEGLEREKGNLKKIIEENEARFRLLGTQPTKKKKKETCKLEDAILSRKENRPKSDMNSGIPRHLLLLLKK